MTFKAGHWGLVWRQIFQILGPDEMLVDVSGFSVSIGPDYAPRARKGDLALAYVSGVSTEGCIDGGLYPRALSVVCVGTRRYETVR